MKQAVLITLLCGVVGQIMAADYYVATNGNDGAAGSLAAPYATIQQAVSVMGAGDACYVRGGIYHEDVTFSGKNNLTFKAYANEAVTMDGTVEVNTPWITHSGSIVKTTLSQDVWQLFAGGEMAMPARWPNAFLQDDTVWDLPNNWARIDHAANTTTSMVDDPTGHSNLSNLTFSVVDAIAVLNVGSFKTYARKVNTHTIGSDTFTVNAVGSLKSPHQYYFLEGKLEFLDVEQEWYYNPATKDLYYWGDTNAVIRGKVQDYAFNVANSSDITISGIDFFATTVYFSGSSNIRVEKGDFNYPSCTKRMLGVHSAAPATTTFWGGSNNIFFDNTMRYAESHAIYMNNGTDNTIENCLFEYIDWSVADLPNLMGTVYMRGSGSVFRGNTAHTTGGSEFIDVNKALVADYNRISNIGLVQNDGAVIQLTIGAQPGSETAYNWFLDSEKYGARFDASTAVGSSTGTNGLMHHNLSFNVKSGIMQKGDYHECFNNTSFDCDINGLIILLDNVSTNDGTVVRNNAAERLSSHRSSYVPLYSGTIYDHNWNGYENGNADIRTLLRDPDNFDFRPLPDSLLVDGGVVEGGLTDGYYGPAPDIGAYEHGTFNYWIPGRQEAEASIPVPPNGSATVKASASLMWLPGLESTSSEVYLGTSSNTVATATTNDVEYVGNPVNNMYDPLGLLAQTYFWRVDENTPTGTVKGAVWSFTVPTASPSAPGIVNTAATGITGTTADIGGQITDGGTGSRVWIYWWPEGGATNEVYMGAHAGAYYLSLSGLQNDEAHYYYAYAENSYGSNTTAGTESFMTGGGSPNPQAMYFVEQAATPSTGVVASNTPTTHVWHSITVAKNDGVGDAQMYGQTFKSASAFNLSAISFHATSDTKTYGTNQILQLSILEDTDANDIPDTITGGVFSVEFPAIDGSRPWKTMRLANAIPLEGNKAYGFVYTLIGPITNNLRVSNQNPGTYADGKGINTTYTVGTFPGTLPVSLNSARDIAFVIQSDAEGDTLYGDWIAGYSVSGSDGMGDNPDGDKIDNLAEYGLGGVPDVFDNGPVPTFENLKYVYRRRTDAVARGLTYALEECTNLISNDWNTVTNPPTGSAPLESGFESVTNTIPTTETNQFIRLRISIGE